MGKIIILVFILVLGGLIYRLLKPVLNNKPSVKYTEEGVKSFTELKEELEFKVAFYKKKVEDGHKEAAEMKNNKIKEKIENDLWKEFRMQDLTPSMRDALVDFVSKQVYKQTKQLKKQLEEKEKEVERLNDELKLNRADAIKYKQDFDEKCCTVANLADDVEQLQSQLSEKDKELSELKAKHEKDVKNAWQKGSESWIRGAQTAEQYYNQTHGQ